QRVGEFQVARSTDKGNQGFTVRITQHSRLGYMVTTLDEDGQIVAVPNPTADLDDALAAAPLQNLSRAAVPGRPRRMAAAEFDVRGLFHPGKRRSRRPPGHRRAPGRG